MEAIKKKMQMLKVDKENALDASEEAEGPGFTHLAVQDWTACSPGPVLGSLVKV